ncbi:MAG: hypothetical protein NTU44_02740 [Bacteroidetes bacterium]|nr:hypothetical protein [Bacteroidota bacterium]
MRVFRYIIRIVLFLIGIAALISASILGYLTITDFRPKSLELLPIKGISRIYADPTREINLLIWNIGYAGLGKDMDFFYDGGTRVRPSLEQYQSYLNGIYNFISKSDTIDFILLQEVDIDAKRSYFINQVDLMTKNMEGFEYSFAKNYDVKFVPFPIFAPMARVTAGLMTMTRFLPSAAERLASSVNFSWPKRVFFLDRCLLLMRFPMARGKQLVVINLHQSAWEDGALLRKAEMELLRETMMYEYSVGHYVIAGGDWNLNPPEFQPGAIKTGDKVRSLGATGKGGGFPPEWQWTYDMGKPTNRDVDKPYKRGNTSTTISDYFLVSPNIRVEEITTIYNGFAFSDHHPVYLRVKLLTDSMLNAKPIPRP